MNQRLQQEELQQAMVVDEYPPSRQARQPWFTMRFVPHPLTSLVMIGLFALFLSVLFLFWAIPHREEVVRLATSFWQTILSTLTLVVEWMVPILLVVVLLGFIIKWNIKPAIECYQQFLVADGQKAKNKVLAQEQHYAVIDESTTHGKWEPKFYQVSEDHITYHFKGEIGSPEQAQLSPLPDLHIPTFAESLRTGEIGPGQNDVLICHEIIRDDEGKLTGETLAYRDALENNCTMFLGGGSKSGKSTLMVGLAGQEAMMRARFYVIDPHLINPDKSIAKRLEPLSSAFILPPAMTDADVYTVLHHARAEALAREQGKETPLSGLPIVFLVDEVLNLFGRAQRSDNRDIQQLYRELALFMRDLGAQYNKFGMNGLFASQYVTKDAFKLPGGNVDFRDACQSQGLLRLPPNQAQAMRMLTPAELAGMRKLAPGHGYMAFSGGDIIRMACGNVTRQDMEDVARMIDPPKLSRQFSPGARVVPSEPRWCPAFEPAPPILQSTMKAGASMPGQTDRQTGALQNRCDPPVEPASPSTREHLEGTEGTTRVKKRFTPAQELAFINLYSDTPNIRKCLSTMHLSQGDYQAYASQVVEQRKLRKT